MEAGGFLKRGSNTKMTGWFGLNSIFGKEVNEIIIGKKKLVSFPYYETLKLNDASSVRSLISL